MLVVCHHAGLTRHVGGPSWRVRPRLLPGTRATRYPRPTVSARTPGVRMPASAVRPAPAGNQFRAAPHKAVEHLPWTLRRHNLVKAPVPRPVPLVRKVCLEGKWTDRAAPGIGLHLLASNLARLPAEPVRRGLCLRSLGRAPSKQPWAHRRGWMAMTKHGGIRDESKKGGRRRGPIVRGLRAFQDLRSRGFRGPALRR